MGNQYHIHLLAFALLYQILLYINIIVIVLLFIMNKITVYSFVLIIIYISGNMPKFLRQLSSS